MKARLTFDPPWKIGAIRYGEAGGWRKWAYARSGWFDSEDGQRAFVRVLGLRLTLIRPTLSLAGIYGPYDGRYYVLTEKRDGTGN